jgi:hypothetical protein
MANVTMTQLIVQLTPTQDWMLVWIARNAMAAQNKISRQLRMVFAFRLAHLLHGPQYSDSNS